MIKNIFNYLFCTTSFDNQAGVTRVNADTMESSNSGSACWGGGI